MTKDANWKKSRSKRMALCEGRKGLFPQKQKRTWGFTVKRGEPFVKKIARKSRGKEKGLG